MSEYEAVHRIVKGNKPVKMASGLLHFIHQFARVLNIDCYVWYWQLPNVILGIG